MEMSLVISFKGIFIIKMYLIIVMDEKSRNHQSD